MDKGCYAKESDTLIFSPTISSITLTYDRVVIARLRNDGAAEFDWPAIETTAAKWDAGSHDTLVSMARLLLLANNSAPTEYDAVAAEREWCAKAVDHILREGGGTWGDFLRLGPNNMFSGAPRQID